MNSKTPRPSCTVIVCTRNRPHELTRCLAALAALDNQPVEVLVVDNASDGSRAHEIASHFGARYLKESVVGLSRARNEGARFCSTEVVAFLDDDAVPAVGWLDALLAEFVDPMVMVVTSRIQPLPVDPEMALFAHFPCLERRVVDSSSPLWFEMANFGGLGDGCMALRRSAFAAWPGFDERMGRGAPIEGGEEHYAIFALLERGFRVVHTPAALVQHPTPAALNALRESQVRDRVAASGYIALLFCEHPQHRWAVLRYVLQSAKGSPRVWRGTMPRGNRLVGKLRLGLASLEGVLVYAGLTMNRRIATTLRRNASYRPRHPKAYVPDLERTNGSPSH